MTTRDDAWKRALTQIADEFAGAHERTTADRAHFMLGVERLAKGDVEEAIESFRQAARKDEPPFDSMAKWALGQCERTRGKQGLALKLWHTLGEDDCVPQATRYMAWLSVAALQAERG
ncbi:MAG: tetratricopeptide repeat protein, partial [Myxococcota bacterium]